MRIEVVVKLFAKQTKLEQFAALDGLSTNNMQFCAYLTMPPADGKANQQLIDLISNHFDVRRGQVTIVSGASSKHKIIDIIL